MLCLERSKDTVRMSVFSATIMLEWLGMKIREIGLPCEIFGLKTYI